MRQQTGFARVAPSSLPRRGTDRKRFDERPQAVRQWLAELPLASLGETSRRVQDALKTLHSVGVSPEQRLDVLGQFEPCIAYLVDGLRKLYQRQPLPLPGRSRTAASMVMKLFEEMARGYYLALMTDKGRFIGLDPGQRAQASLHACRYTGLALLESWLLYEQPPQGTWSLLHELWEDARKRDLHRRSIAVPGAHPQRVDDTYKQLLLTEAANPWQLPRGEVLKIHRLLGHYAGKANLVPGHSRTASETLFVVDQGQDLGPRPLQSGAAPGSGSVLRIVTEGVCRALMASIRKSGGLFGPDRHTRGETQAECERIQRLSTALGHPPRRRHQRQRTKRGATVVIGLGRIHRMLLTRALSGSGPDPEITASFPARDPLLDLSNNDYDIWRVIYSPAREATTVDRNPQIWPVEGNGPPPIGGNDGQAEHSWVVINSNRHGYCLAADPVTHSTAQVGELIILAETGDTTHPNWQTGVIRWIKRSQSDGTHMGVQVVASSPHPVFTRTENPGGRLSEPKRCLLIPALPDVNQPMALITPTLHYGAGGRVYLMGKSRTGELQLTRQIAGTALFRQFAFSRLGTRIPAETTVPKREMAWSII